MISLEIRNMTMPPNSTYHPLTCYHDCNFGCL